MKQRRTTFVTLITTALLMTVGIGQTLAGGLKDTGYEFFSTVGFPADPSDLSANPWWHPAGEGKALYFADTDDGCEWNLIEDAGQLVDAFSGPDFSGDYAMTFTRIVLDRAWLVEDMDCEETSFEEAYADEENLEEITYDWYAIDDENNIWYMGEDTFDGESNEGSFAAGCDGAEPGIVMLGGMPSKGTFYKQEFYEEEAEDWGKVLNYVEMEDINCMKTKEWTPLEPGAIEHKYYCAGDLVLIEELKGKTVEVELFEGAYVAPPAPVGGSPSPIPVCELED